MTTIDHQQAAVRAMTVDFRPSPYLNSDQNDEQRSAYWVAMRDKLTAAAPHLRAGIAEEVRNLRSQFHDDAKTAFGRIGSSTEAYLNALDDVLALLEGGGE